MAGSRSSFLGGLCTVILISTCTPGSLSQDATSPATPAVQSGEADPKAQPDTSDAEALKKKQQEADEKDPTKLTDGKFAPLAARSLGPAIYSGRVGDLAVNPRDPSEFYVAVSSGNLWKTINAGVTFSPVFDSYGSFSIGCVTLDPNNPSVVWVGSGENNSQRSVSPGDGVYVSRDAGKSFVNVGLKDSNHIGMIRVDPRDSSVVYVAAMGPLWSDGGDRGVFKTIDGGKTWTKSLDISAMTGCNEVHMDPRNPDVLYATAYQRRRHVWTLIDGGPESAIYKSTDAGRTWRKLTSGIPGGDMGRIGLAVSPVNPDVVFAIIEANEKDRGIYRSTDRGESWEKRSGYATTSPQYYNELFADPQDADRLYALDTFAMVSDDAGKTLSRMVIPDTHVDSHALWIDPTNTDHMLFGNDGGLYESWDRRNWRHFENLPVMQFYRVAVDNSEPFYFVYGGTQDNGSIGGPSRTTDRAGVTNEDWFLTHGGDGFETVIDPKDPSILYAESQDGALVRFDRRSGEEVDIRPVEKANDKGFVFNWDSPVILSPHKHTRLYFGGNFLFRSDDRGDSWTRISEDLTRGLDRDQFKVLGVIQKPDAIAKHMSTSIFGNAVALSESPKVEGLLYVGTDDGVIHVTEDAGKVWRKMLVEAIAGVPEMAYVSDLEASQTIADRVYATFENHKKGDYAAYVFVSDDRGVTWRSIAGDLAFADTAPPITPATEPNPAPDAKPGEQSPENDAKNDATKGADKRPKFRMAYAIAEDHVNPNLLFLATELGVYFTLDGGSKWFALAGLPAIEARDLDIQRRENDLAIATFGRGFYILHDYAPLRTITSELFAKDAHVFPIKPALSYVEKNRLGGARGRGWSGAAYYNAPNPPFGAAFTYYLKEKLRSRKELRLEAEKKDGWKFPAMEALREEDKEKEPAIIALIKDASGTTLRTLSVSPDAGLHRASWDLRFPPVTARGMGSVPSSSWDGEEYGNDGTLVPPGAYSITIASVVDGVTKELTKAETFEVRDLNLATLAAKDATRNEKFNFERRVADLQRALDATGNVLGEVQGRIDQLRVATNHTPGIKADTIIALESLRARAREISIALSGDPTLGRRMIAQPASIQERVGAIVGSLQNTTQPATITQREQFELCSVMLTKSLADLRTLAQKDLAEVERTMDGVHAPWTPGRWPVWE